MRIGRVVERTDVKKERMDLCMGMHLKFNPQTGEYDIPCTWVESLKATAENSWIPRWRKEEVLKIADALTEEEAKRMCKKLDKEIQGSIEEWRMYQ